VDYFPHAFPVPYMTYKVFGGTLNLTLSIYLVMAVQKLLKSVMI